MADLICPKCNADFTVSGLCMRSQLDRRDMEIFELMENVSALKKALQVACWKIEGHDPAGWPLDRFLEILGGNYNAARS